MLFKKKKSLSIPSLLLLTALTTSSCGLLGSKSKPETTSAGNVGSTGCLNDSKDIVTRYAQGQLTSDQWKSTFTCVNQSLDFFTQYVHGADSKGYTQNDMYNLVSKFLITNGKVNAELMAGAFALKSALFGGSSQTFTDSEITLLKSSLITLSDIGAGLIPYLQMRRQPNPSNEEIMAMVTAFQTAGNQLSDFVKTLPTGILTETSVVQLVNNLTVVLNLPSMDNFGDTLFLAKWIIFNTRRDLIESADWAQFFKTAMGLGGVYLAYQTAVGPNPATDPRGTIASRIKNDYRFREFIWNLALTAKPYLDDTLARHDGLLPFPILDHIVDQLPASLADTVPPENLKSVFRPVLRKLFNSSTQMGLDQPSLDTTFDLGNEIIQKLGALDRFYEKTGIDTQSTSLTDMRTAMTQYGTTLTTADDLDRFRIIKNSILGYQPMFNGDTGYIRYDYHNGYSYSQTFLTTLLDIAVNFLHQNYGTGAGGTFVENDFENVFKDFNDFLYSMKLLDPTGGGTFPQKRFQDISLFTPLSQGATTATPQQITYYAMIILSASKMAGEMRGEITPVCDAGLAKDIMGWVRIPATCFRTQFDQRLSYWIGNFPHLQTYWNTLNAEEQAQAMKWLEHGARRNGYNNDDFGSFDFTAMATILHYTETLFERFDGDQSQGLDKSEIMNAYPVFKSLLAKKTPIGKNTDYILKGLFSYIVKYREMPDLNLQLAWWLLIYELPTTNYSADRSTVFNIVCQLAAPDSVAQQGATGSICAP